MGGFKKAFKQAHNSYMALSEQLILMKNEQY